MADTDIFDALKALLSPYASEMSVKQDTPQSYYLERPGKGGKPEMFGAVMVKKSYVAFHFFPIYCHPELLDGMSDDLRKRMQGKSCFNFSNANQIPLTELEALVMAGSLQS